MTTKQWMFHLGRKRGKTAGQHAANPPEAFVLERRARMRDPEMVVITELMLSQPKSEDLWDCYCEGVSEGVGDAFPVETGLL